LTTPDQDLSPSQGLLGGGIRGPAHPLYFEAAFFYATAAHLFFAAAFFLAAFCFFGASFFAV
jgi:hypothetical protein